jgi:2-polyprenyl-6-methoxyphenol hydroxylase-like FAD-dependent oxidoreductase
LPRREDLAVSEIATVTGSEAPVLIVGAGPTGLVAAIELVRRGVPIHLVDRLPQPLPWSAAIFIKSRTLEILADLDLVGRFLEQGEIVNGVNFFLGESLVASYRCDDVDSPYPYILSIPESETVSLLTKKLNELGGQVERGVEFVGLEELDDRVRVRLSSLERGEYRLEASWVVGTDGYHSAVREVIGDDFDGRDYPQLWGVVDTELANWRHPRNLACAQLQPPNIIPFPLGENRWRVYFRTEKTNETALAAAGERLALISPGAELVNTAEPQFFRSHGRIARRFRIGRVFLAGDAAHVSNPVEGHGMNAGIHDAYNLGWKLGLMVSGTATEELIESYERERRTVDRKIVESGDGAEGRMAPGADDARKKLIEFLATSEGQHLAALAESEITYTYSNSPIVAEAGAAAPSLLGTQIGSRVGDAPGLMGHEGVFSFHDLIKGVSASLFITADAAEREAVDAWLSLLARARDLHPSFLGRAYVVLRGPPGEAPVPEGVLHDSTGWLHDRLSDGRPTLCLIRPDGHLGFRCTPPSLEKLESYLGRVCAKHGSRALPR